MWKRGLTEHLCCPEPFHLKSGASWVPFPSSCAASASGNQPPSSGGLCPPRLRVEWRYCSPRTRWYHLGGLVCHQQSRPPHGSSTRKHKLDVSTRMLKCFSRYRLQYMISTYLVWHESGKGSPNLMIVHVGLTGTKEDENEANWDGNLQHWLQKHSLVQPNKGHGWLLQELNTTWQQNTQAV